MNNKFAQYLIDIILSLKHQALKAKRKADDSTEGLQDYKAGMLMGYYSIITLLKHQAFVFCIDQKELGLEDINPEADLLGLHKNADMEPDENNWAIDEIKEETVKGYLIDIIALIKHQAVEVKKDAESTESNSEEYNKGEIKAYHQVIATMKNQAPIFDLEYKDIGLEDIEPERDLV